MTDHRNLLDDYLDGELPLEVLPEDLAREAREFERIVDAIREERITAAPGLKQQVMTRVHDLARSPRRRFAEWFVTPRLVGLSPAGIGLAAVAALLAMMIAGRGSRPAAQRTSGLETRPIAAVPVDSATTRDSSGRDLGGMPAESAPVRVPTPYEVAALADRDLLAQRLDAATMTQLDPILQEAARDSLPTLVLALRALEGEAKGVPEHRIVTVVRDMASRLRNARMALRQADSTSEPSRAEIAAAAAALEQGVSPAGLTNLARRLPKGGDIEVPLSVLGDLVQRGIAPDAAQGVVAQLVGGNVSTSRMADIVPQMDAALRVEPQPVAALSLALKDLGIQPLRLEAPRPR